MTKPRYFGGAIEPRGLPDVTISVGHDIVAGRRGRAFRQRLADLIENSRGLDRV